MADRLTLPPLCEATGNPCRCNCMEACVMKTAAAGATSPTQSQSKENS